MNTISFIDNMAYSPSSTGNCSMMLHPLPTYSSTWCVSAQCLCSKNNRETEAVGRRHTHMNNTRFSSGPTDLDRVRKIPPACSPSIQKFETSLRCFVAGISAYICLHTLPTLSIFLHRLPSLLQFIEK